MALQRIGFVSIQGFKNRMRSAFGKILDQAKCSKYIRASLDVDQTGILWY
jgi:hypothetical protein